MRIAYTITGRATGSLVLKRQGRDVTIGTMGARGVTAGGRTTVKITLNSRGQQLLAARRPFIARLITTVAQPGFATGVSVRGTQKIRIAPR